MIPRISLATLALLTFTNVHAEDVVIVGATPAGVATAVAAARSGANVALVEETNHVGGIVSGGLTNPDIRKRGAVGGLFTEFTRRVRDYYAKTYGPDSAQVKICDDGNMFEPKVAELVFREMLSGEKNIRLVEHQRVVAARVVGVDGTERNAEPGHRYDGAAPKDFGPTVKIVGITTDDLEHPGTKTEFRARTFVDATYEGDLAALAGVPYRVGRESRDTFGEPHAGQIYIRFADSNPQPGSTGEADNGIQAFCFRFHVTKTEANQVPVEKPDGYRREDYHAIFEDIRAGTITKLTQIIQFYPMPNGDYEVNSDHPHPDTGVPSESLDLAEDNWSWPEAGPEERARIFARYWAYDEGLLWTMQHAEDVPAPIREEALKWGFPKDEFTDHNHRPHALSLSHPRAEVCRWSARARGLQRQPRGLSSNSHGARLHGARRGLRNRRKNRPGRQSRSARGQCPRHAARDSETRRRAPLRRRPAPAGGAIVSKSILRR
jgi:hypothetical protein